MRHPSPLLVSALLLAFLGTDLRSLASNAESKTLASESQGTESGLLPPPSKSPTTESARQERPLVRVQQGQLRGYFDQGIAAFKGIPYGDDTSKTRFRAPLPAPAWEGVREATAFSNIAPQFGGKRGSSSPEAQQAENEDCLHLNVWTPSLSDQKKRPVVVYFHGGAYNGGSVNSDLYDGVHLSRRGDLVVVTVNHRLNGFGYLYLDELSAHAAHPYHGSGNAGMLDLVLALRWVHDNIASFGGDPARVTIFGQSGGGAKCATLMAMPAARGLFQGVWTMSGQQLRGRDRGRATQSALSVLGKLGLTPESIDQLDTIPLARLQEAMRGEAWTPVMDGELLPRDPFWPEASPLSADIPMVLGNTLDETASLIVAGDPSLFQLSWEQLPAKLEQHIKAFIGDLSPADIIAHYRAWYPERSPVQLFIAITTAARSWKGMILEGEARARQNQAPTFVYHLVWRSPVDGGKWGASHTLDIPLVFDNVDKAMAQTGGGEDARRCAALMSEALIAFAHTGNPNHAGFPTWPRHTLPNRETLLFSPSPRLENDPRAQERKLFAPVAYQQPGT